MSFRVIITGTAQDQLDELGRKQQAFIYRYMLENLEGCDDPRLIPGSEQLGDTDDGWRYRVGTYHILSSLSDDSIVVRAVRGGRR